MKLILYIYHTSCIGGGSYCLLNILKTVDRTLYKPMVLLKEDGPLVNEIKNLGIPVYFLGKISTVPYNCSTFTPKKIVNAVRIVSSLRQYRKLLQYLKPDIVYVNTMMLYPYLIPAKKLGISTVIHIREHWPEDEHRIQRNIALKYIDQYANRIVAINSYSASMFDFSKKPKTIVYDWIDMDNRYEEFPLSNVFHEDMEGKKVYLFMGGMQPIKGALEVVSGFSEFVESPDARLLIMGGTAGVYGKSWRGGIKKILSRLGYATYTEKIKKAINADRRIKSIPSMYKINHVIQQSYCILSYFTIPHANLALAESIILGIPTIAARTEESLEYSLNGNLALLFTMNDYKDFGHHIVTYEEYRKDLVENIKVSSERIARMFAPAENSRILNDVYKSL